MGKDNFPIDIILPWVDDSDEHWREKKNKYFPDNDLENAQRYRDFGTLKYVLRSIDRNAPYIRKIFLLTDNQIPEWLDTNNNKIEIVDHKQFISPQNLPTFNSNAIELNSYKIKNLSEHFIVFNDDTLILKKTKPIDFFSKRGVPRDFAVQFVFMPSDDFAHIGINNVILINKQFDKHEWVKKNYKKIFSLKNGLIMNLMNLTLLPLPKITRFFDPHIPLAYTKTNFKKAAEIFEQSFESTSAHKKRCNTDISHWTVRYYQLMTGKFVPRSPKFGKYLTIQDTDGFKKAIKKKHVKTVVLNDKVRDNQDMLNAQNTLRELNDLFPNKSVYEK